MVVTEAKHVFHHNIYVCVSRMMGDTSGSDVTYEEHHLKFHSFQNLSKLLRTFMCWKKIVTNIQSLRSLHCGSIVIVKKI